MVFGKEMRKFKLIAVKFKPPDLLNLEKTFWLAHVHSKFKNNLILHGQENQAIN